MRRIGMVGGLTSSGSASTRVTSQGSPSCVIPRWFAVCATAYVALTALAVVVIVATDLEQGHAGPMTLHDLADTPARLWLAAIAIAACVGMLLWRTLTSACSSRTRSAK
ncbi:hypothetical protein GCM10027169_25950 [Gordonia jinhuaensis]|uniref:Uncharacterized protein n=1 Tax=Gordonia jinhuaensis TaxID=1517702 RepID=A0A916TBQ0_9ACTN|nr:hypothetical protein [Gordonia jinhuaensis]GGB38827.1 hypothetical protein GCM10011489_28160 [Gordonia jinhuaensis]